MNTYGRVECLDLAVAGINDDGNTADRQRRFCDVGRYYYLARARRTLFKHAELEDGRISGTKALDYLELAVLQVLETLMLWY